MAMMAAALPTVFAFDAPVFFEKKCSSCHTIGQGDDIGPDLKDVTKRRDKVWLYRFVRESQSMIQEGDPLANELFNKFRKKKMPDQQLSDSEMEELFKFIESGKSSGAGATYRSVVKATPFDIEKGKELFLGVSRLKNGGPACLSCHRAGGVGPLGGGRLGPDLSQSYSGYGDTGLSKVLTKISFPSMIKVYENKNLTEDEVFQLKAFLYEMDRSGKKEVGFTKKFIFFGIVGFLLVLGFFDLLWKGRRKKTRRPI